MVKEGSTLLGLEDKICEKWDIPLLDLRIQGPQNQTKPKFVSSATNRGGWKSRVISPFRDALAIPEAKKILLRWQIDKNSPIHKNVVSFSDPSRRKILTFSDLVFYRSNDGFI